MTHQDGSAQQPTLYDVIYALGSVNLTQKANERQAKRIFDALIAQGFATSVPLQGEVSSLRQAAQAFVGRLEYIHEHPRFRSVWEVSQMHIGPYDGPTYIDEFAALKDALAASVPSPAATELESANNAIRALTEKNVQLSAQVERLRTGIQDYLDGKYDTPPSENSPLKCKHDVYFEYACEACIDQHFQRMLAGSATDSIWDTTPSRTPAATDDDDCPMCAELTLFNQANIRVAREFKARATQAEALVEQQKRVLDDIHVECRAEEGAWENEGRCREYICERIASLTSTNETGAHHSAPEGHLQPLGEPSAHNPLSPEGSPTRSVSPHDQSNEASK